MGTAETAGTLASQIGAACARAQTWFRRLPSFPTRSMASEGGVVGFRGPTLLSEEDCALHFARHLSEVGVPWEALHTIERGMSGGVEFEECDHGFSSTFAAEVERDCPGVELRIIKGWE